MSYSFAFSMLGNDADGFDFTFQHAKGQRIAHGLFLYLV